MQAALTFAGPGVAEGKDLGQVRLIDVAPTLCALVGIEPPANAQGRVIQPALARR
jgi:arylsulfatase A-like enzyme